MGVHKARAFLLETAVMQQGYVLVISMGEKQYNYIVVSVHI